MVWIPRALGAAGMVLIVVAIVHERLMHRHRRPGVTYGQATFRRDGGWRRADLFTEPGLAHQRRASAYGFGGLALVVIALVSWVILTRLSPG